MIHRLDDYLYPVTPDRAEGMLEVGQGHAIHWMEAGNPQGIPMVDCHGGPGGKANPYLRRILDPERLRIVQFSQRGCGQSTPSLSTQHNTLQHTVADMERLREHLGIERWAVGGLSWGSTVALTYAQTHPSRCLGVKVGGVWLLRPADIEWWYQGVRRFFPDTWSQFASLAPMDRQHALRAVYHELINGEDRALAATAGQSLYEFEETFMHLEAPFAPPNPDRGLAYATIFSHYATNDFFLEPDQLVRDAGTLRGLHVSLLTGRYDACTTPDQAWDLAQALEPADVRLEFVSAAGHYPSEPPMSAALAHQTRLFIDELERRGVA